MNKEIKYLMAFILPIMLILGSIIRPVYYSLAYHGVVDATIIGVTEVTVNFFDNSIKKRVGVYKYNVNGQTFTQPFGKNINESKEKYIVGTKKRIRVSNKNPEKIYRYIPYDFADFMFLICGVVFLTAIILYKEDLNL